MESVEVLMMKEHERIRQMVREFEKSFNEKKGNLKDVFNKVKWNVEKHFFVEEKAIFSMMEKLLNGEVAEIFDLMKEHGEIIEIIRGIEGLLDSENIPHITGLREKLENHADFEDKIFYPKLDTLLNNQQKEEIIEKAKEIIRG